MKSKYWVMIASVFAVAITLIFAGIVGIALLPVAMMAIGFSAADYE